MTSSSEFGRSYKQELIDKNIIGWGITPCQGSMEPNQERGCPFLFKSLKIRALFSVLDSTLHLMPGKLGKAYR
jgi:hypothetical protein